jgi:2',3'-cyclic-nucleotide 2'-phosphodiesterase (5'-nucleotidase family)
MHTLKQEINTFFTHKVRSSRLGITATPKSLVLAALFLVGCSSQGPRSETDRSVEEGLNPFTKFVDDSFENPLAKGDKRLLFLFSGHTMGEIDICGCSMNPKGGIDRRLNFVRNLRLQKSIPVMIFDSGNALFATENILRSQQKKAEDKASLILKGYKTMAVGAVNVGTLDLSLGVAKLKELASKNDVKFISTNLVDEKNQYLFETEHLTPYEDFQILVLGVSLGSELTEKKGIRVLDPIPTVLKRVEKLPPKTIVLVLSDMGQTKDEELAQQSPVPLMIVGSRETYSLEIPIHVNRSIVMRPHFQGQQWSQFEVEWKSNGQNWYNFEASKLFHSSWEVRQKSYEEIASQKNLTDDQKNDLRFIENAKKEMLNYLPGDLKKSTFYSFENHSLTEEYSKPNEFTPMIKKLVK